ncbi:MBL fold metallo-hydrolase [Pyxidicoccus parkwayensis]|uniref:MBL fold metallo-hydrolase n=1 Tax=Pyxidicoccus parkwayensis TaxID=2813578 RepID=A0ABX7NVD3_9BACT|nr:MBL fold metallo-hydrolase [Pyxidicoccus parkwaysis]QSQ21427.1 MBL fold metallo-hydrolase [Pyxidicoccus parkwaysis]
MGAHLTASQSLTSLTRLDRRWLHLFVCGPGTGEGLALALPGSGWVFVDACMIDGRSPQQLLLEQYREPAGVDPLRAMVLTHPHQDHASGFAELVDVLVPESIATTGNPPPKYHLVEAVEALLSSTSSQVTSARTPAATVLAAARAIKEWERKTGRQLAPLRDGEALSTGTSLASIACRAPTDADITSLLGPPPSPHLARNANHLSAVLEVLFGQTRVVLGGDLPRYESLKARTVSVPSGWDAVITRHPHLAGHGGLKVPHHASTYALHPQLISPTGPQARGWCVTPYRSKGLPRTEPGDGLSRLLAAEPSVHVTAPPASCERKGWVPPSVVTLQQLHHEASTVPTGDALLDRGTDIRGGGPKGPLDNVWCVAFDDAGQVVGRWRGPQAFEVTQGPIT